ncbi:ABC transporter permease subunit [Frigoribacterium sp. CG_9.8]|uniref:ABC transporter permease subunit n=1 Tax=Frigoribacterium sp. CG_9.8 TaxID=2787733 RepID=UPI0018C9F96D|nr:glutamate transport system permease protein [Frigoribacterium sp. CG_9.8]
MSSNVLFDSPGPKARRRSLIFSIIALVVVAAIVLWAILTLAAPRLSSGIKLPGSFDPSRWDIFSDPRVWRDIGLGVLATLEAAAVASVLALAIGVAFSLLRTSVFPWVRIPATVVLEFFRGMPVLLLMLFILLVSSFGTFWAVVLGLAVYNGAIIGEILRAGVASLPRGQREAGLSLGLTRLQTKSFIEYPQAFRQMLPVIVAQLVVLLKDTSLGYIVGYSEIIRTTMTEMLSFHGDRYKFSLYVITLVIYLGVNLSVSAFARRLARRRPAR